MNSLLSSLRRRDRRSLALAGVGFALIALAGAWSLRGQADEAKAPAVKPAGRPALTVALVAPAREEWPVAIRANGNVVAWQEAVIGPEIGGQRIAEVLVNVGDTVKKGQLLARIASENVAADLGQSRALVVEAEAAAAEAAANAERARRLKDKGFYSAQQASQVLTAEQTAQARLASARAKLAADELRLSQTRVVAPDAGLISARGATVGSLAQPGQELFRLVRGGRLEWRAEVTAAEVGRLKPGMTARIQVPGQAESVSGRLRAVAPTADPQTRSVLAYVDLPANSPARAGTFARGEFDAGRATALTLPQTAVLPRDGFNYVYRVGNDGRLVQLKVGVGRRVGDRIEITGGLDESVKVVESGVGFLADGDLVRVAGNAGQ